MHQTRQNPYTGVIGAFTGLGLCMVLALHWGTPGWWGSPLDRAVLLWAILAIVFLMMGLLDQVVFGGFRATQSPRPAYHDSWQRVLYSAVWRFTTLYVLILLARYIYFNHPLYTGDFYKPFRDFFTYPFYAFIGLGFPYIVVTLRWRGSLKAELKDPALHILLWIRTALRGVLRLKTYRRGVAYKNRRSKIVLLGFLVEFFYLPLMTVFFHNQFNDFASALIRVYFMRGPADFYNGYYPIFYHGIYLMDVLLAMGGYALPLRWLDNKIKSVEPTFFGWFVALMCYPPFDFIGNTYLTYGTVTTDWTAAWPGVLMASKILVLVFAFIYSASTMMFGTRFSNLTNRGILTRGPYGWVRHPAYIAKNLSWWCERLPVLSNPLNTLALIAWNLIYALRAWTEERHLSKDPAYRDYCKQVPYRFIPGIL